MSTISLNLSYSAGLEPVFDFIPLGYDITSSTGRLIIRKEGQSLHDSSVGITVVEVELVKDLRYRDGTVIPSGTTVKALRVAPDFSGVDPPLADPDNEKPSPYSYGLYVDDVWSIQGILTVWPDTGNMRCQGVIAVNCGPVQVAVSGGAIQGPVGEQGAVGPPGPWEANVRIISRFSDSVVASDQSIIILAGGNDIIVSMPDPMDLYDIDTQQTKTITFYRPADDTGSVTLTGVASNLPDALFPDEGRVVQSYGTALAVRW